MYNLSPPTAGSAEAFDAAVATISNEEKRLHFERAAPTVQLCCGNFNQLAASRQFELAKSDDFNVPELNDYERAMAKLYEDQFLKGVRVSSIRDSIRSSAPNDLCPYCGEGLVAELDHYLPKASFAGTTVHPANLVPVCRDCNYAKQAYVPGPAAPAVLNPYFDTAFSIRWLSATVREGEHSSPLILFSVRLDQADPRLEARLNAHMQVFKLKQKFSTKGAQSLDDFQRLLSTEFGQNMSLEGAREDLRRMARQRSGGRINSWEGAAYEAMAASDWYLIDYLGLS